MKRRDFLATTLLGSVSSVALSGQAFALSERSCAEVNDAACRELVRHHDLVAALGAELARKGVAEPERARLLKGATCPFCGLPLQG